MDARDGLPVHTVSDEVRRQGPATIRIDGLVAREVRARPSDLAKLARVTLEEPFACEEGWVVAGLRWGGVALVDVLALAEPLPRARFVTVSSSGYTVNLPLGDASGVMLADVLNDQALALEHGGPWRLVVPGSQCFTSVKWVDSLHLTAEPEASSGERIARERLARHG
jgi:DMSO/TMAO reductase YedYZ molybdopterin-dependent catalytic subunit